MKQFFKFMFASMLGFILSAIVLVFLLIALIAGVASSMEGKKEVEVKDNSILRLTLNYPIEERTSENPFDNINFGDGGEDDNQAIGLNDILKSIRHAKDDAHIKGIFLDLSIMQTGMANAEEIRNALIEFKKSKKFIIAYGEIYTQGSYYIASVADKIYLNPSGDMLFNGFSSNSLYMKTALEKMGLQAQVIKHGKFKSAGETFVEDKMSEENRKQVEEFVGAMYQHFMERVASARKKPVAEVYDMADNLRIQQPKDALALGMIDGLMYRDEVMNELRKRVSAKEDDKLKFINIGKYTDAVPASSKAKEKIAVIYAVGDIISGQGDEETIGSDKFASAFKKAREDKNVKAVVLRVNSPGGSAMASDVIWREVMLTKKEKPVIVSMGNVAASGGYYISLAADTIVAQPNTITGSIGVIGVMINAQKLMNEKLGLHLDGVKFGKYADLGRMDRPLNPDEEAIVQKAIDRIYVDFVTKVAKGRGMSYEAVDAIAQGRVWSGVDAKKIGLVDVLGGIETAIDIAAKRAGLTDYRITSLPEQEDPIQSLIKSFGGVKENLLKEELKENYVYYRQLQKALNCSGIQARIPFEVVIE
jgi:protease-4